MVLYHGTNDRNISKFDLNKGRKKLDFGQGVYFTTNFQQAKDWSCKHSDQGAVYECNIDLSNLNGFDFTKSNEDTYYYIYLCRLDLEELVQDAIDGVEKADYIKGVMLDGKMKDFEALAEKFNEGDIALSEFKECVLFFDDKDQICIKSEKAIARINACINNKYYTKKNKKNGKIEFEK